MTPIPERVRERFWSRIDVRAPDECWPCLLTATTKDPNGTSTGYHQMGWAEDGHTVSRLAHRLAYELTHGPIPDGAQIDHVCHNQAAEAGLCEGGGSCPHRACCNPAHLEAVTGRENTLRSLSPTAINARKTHCLRGHPFDAENTYERPLGRDCRECARERDRSPKRVAAQRARRARRALEVSQ